MITPDEFLKLSPEDQAKIFQESPLAEKGELLMMAHYPERLANSLTREELYLVTREMDIDSRSEIIRYANLPQLFFISDIDCWRKDRLSGEGFISWLEMLEKADEARLLAWLAEMDYEAVVAGFKNVVTVMKPDWEYASDELLGDLAYFTLDDRYFIYVKEENLATVRRAFELLFEHRRGRYAAVLEGIIDEMDDILEEDAFSKRRARLADMGFPDQDSAFMIYRPMTPEEFKAFPPKKNAAAEGAADRAKIKMPNYVALWSPERFFLDDVLLLLKEGPSETLDGVEEEMVWLSNKVIACEGIDFSSEQNVRHGIERARRYVSIGLEILSGGDVPQAAGVIGERWLENIFRVATARLLKLRDEAAAILRQYWKSDKVQFLNFLPSPYEIIFQGLLRNIPEYYDSARQEDKAYDFRDFKNLEEVLKAERAISQVRTMHQIVFARLEGMVTKRLKKISADGDSQMALTALCGMAFADFVLARENGARSLTKEEVGEFLNAAFEVRGKRRYIKADLKEKFLTILVDEKDRELLTSLLGLVFQEIEEELGGIELSRAFDRRYVSCLWIEDDGGSKRKARLKSPSVKKRTKGEAL